MSKNATRTVQRQTNLENMENSLKFIQATNQVLNHQVNSSEEHIQHSNAIQKSQGYNQVNVHQIPYKTEYQYASQAIPKQLEQRSLQPQIVEGVVRLTVKGNKQQIEICQKISNNFSVKNHRNEVQRQNVNERLYDDFELMQEGEIEVKQQDLRSDFYKGLFV